MVEMFIKTKSTFAGDFHCLCFDRNYGAIKMPITQFPDIVPPSVTVTAKYTGANAEVSAMQLHCHWNVPSTECRE
jgi:multidrug efflux pump subunit AcrB